MTANFVAEKAIYYKVESQFQNLENKTNMQTCNNKRTQNTSNTT